MPDLEALLERADHLVQGIPLPVGGFDRIDRRAHTRRRNARIRAGAVALAIVALLALAGDRIFVRSHGIPADEGPPQTAGPFTGLARWITYSSNGDVYAVDTSVPGSTPRLLLDLPDAVQPLSWSSGGTDLLVSRNGQGDGEASSLAILHEDGSLMAVPSVKPGTQWGVFAPDGSIVVEEPFLLQDRLSARVMRVDPGTGSKVAVGTAPSSGADWTPAVAPDGTVAVLHVDDGQVSVDVISPGERRTIVPSAALPKIWDVDGMAWSPDGSQLVFGLFDRDKISRVYVVAADGSDLRESASHAGWPGWSPDGTRISFIRFSDREVVTAARDGSNVRELGTVLHLDGDRTGPWAPAPSGTG